MTTPILAPVLSALLLGVVAPGPPVTLQAGHVYQFRYRLVRSDHMGIERDGNLRLHFSSGGAILGYYGYDDELATMPVTGNRSGDQFWLDLGASTMTLLHVYGTIAADGSLVGHAYETRRANPYYDFSAQLKP